MKKLFLVFLVAITFKMFSQDSLSISQIKLKSQIFSLSPISKKVNLVNGLALGVGHYDNKNIQKQTVNGLNLEVNPLCIGAPFLLLTLANERFQIKNGIDEFDNNSLIKINGINITTGGFLSRAQLNGVNISTFTQMEKMNGLSVSGLVTSCKSAKGISISGILSYNQKINGLAVGLINHVDFLKGAQFGIYNNCNTEMTGIQIGLINISEKTRGLQIGLLNINKKRAMPFINF